MAVQEIAHKGRVKSVTPEWTVVEIVSESACASCHAAALCGMSEGKVKDVQVPTRGWDSFEPGQEVSVVLKASMGHKAVWIAYVAPLLVMLAALLASLSLGCGELAAGLVAIGATALYYIGVWMMRRRLQNEYVFEIREITTNTNQ